MKIENYREQNPSQTCLALFDVYIPAISLTLANIKLCVSKKGCHFLGYPSFADVQDDGSKKWNPFFFFSEEKKKDFENKVFELLKDFVRFSLNRWSAQAR